MADISAENIELNNNTEEQTVDTVAQAEQTANEQTASEQTASEQVVEQEPERELTFEELDAKEQQAEEEKDDLLDFAGEEDAPIQSAKPQDEIDENQTFKTDTSEPTELTAEKAELMQMTEEERKEFEKRQKLEQRRIELGHKRPVDYCYSVGQTKTGNVEYVEVLQTLNDKFNGGISQQQYFAVAEQTRRIFSLNQMMIETCAEDSSTTERLRFAVQVSAKWLTVKGKKDVLKELLSALPAETVIIVDAVSLAVAGQDAFNDLKELLTEYKLKLLLDNVEYLNFIQFVGYHADYIRFDARFFDTKDESYEKAFRFVKDYAKTINTRLVIKNIGSKEKKLFFANQGADVMEGSHVYGVKRQLSTILADFKMQSL